MEILSMDDISKSFYGVEVLHHVSLHVRKGAIHALLGENGAGKSTLMNILGGVYTRDSGTIVFDGKDYPTMSIKEAENAGIAFVHQELNPFNTLKVYENIYIGDEITNKAGFLKKREMIKRAQELFDELGIGLKATDEVGSLSTADKQLIEICHALHKNAKLIILDEPTTALSNEEIEHLFQIVHRLQEAGKTFIFISHKMPEIFRYCDDYTVLRNGDVISTGKIKDATPEELTREIAGKSSDVTRYYRKHELGPVVLRVENLSGAGFKDISLEARKGEIIGLTGLQGAGSSEFLQTLFGAMKADSGSVYVNGELIKPNSVKRTMKHSIGMIPANRKENSIIPEMCLTENTTIAEHELTMKKPFVKKRDESRRFNDYRDKLGIRCSSGKDLIISLSGGNQQKAIVARWLNTDCDILLLDNPTQGIDVGAKDEIYKLLITLAEAGKTILFNTLEVPEIMKVADRCFVFYHGRVEKVLSHNEINEETVIRYATNANKVRKGKEPSAVAA